MRQNRTDRAREFANWLATESNKAELRACHYDQLDVLRAQLPAMPTAALLATLINPEQVMDAIFDSVPMPEDRDVPGYEDRIREACALQDKLAAAVTLALCDEVDLRVPPRERARVEPTAVPGAGVESEQ